MYKLFSRDSRAGAAARDGDRRSARAIDHESASRGERKTAIHLVDEGDEPKGEDSRENLVERSETEKHLVTELSGKKLLWSLRTRHTSRTPPHEDRRSLDDVTVRNICVTIGRYPRSMNIFMTRRREKKKHPLYGKVGDTARPRR